MGKKEGYVREAPSYARTHASRECNPALRKAARTGERNDDTARV